MPIDRNLTVADGQVAAAAASILSGEDTAKRYDLIFSNTGSAEQTLILTISRNGGTARRLFRKILAVNEQLLITGLPLNRTDSLLAVTSNASSVDYVVSFSTENAPFGIQATDENGDLKVAPAMLEQLAAAFG